MQRDGTWKGRPALVTIWIDQDEFLVRGWSVELATDDPLPQVVCGCSYYVLAPDGPMNDDLFQKTPPKPIVLPNSERETEAGSSG